MYFGKVIGSVVSTVKISHIADTVLVMDEGTGTRQILGLDPGAIRAVVVGVVDEVDVDGAPSISGISRKPRAQARS